MWLTPVSTVWPVHAAHAMMTALQAREIRLVASPQYLHLAVAGLGYMPRSMYTLQDVGVGAGAYAAPGRRLMMRRSSSLSASMDVSTAAIKADTPRRSPSDSVATEPILMAGELSVFETKSHPDEPAQASADDPDNHKYDIGPALGCLSMSQQHVQCYQ